MKSYRVFGLLVAVVFLLLAISCSNGSITEPTLGWDRDAECGGGNGGCGGGNGGSGGSKPPCPSKPPAPAPAPPCDKWDCLRLFDVTYYITSSSGLALKADGRVAIFDKDCDADKSDVFVKFMYKPDLDNSTACNFLCIMGGPGTKTVTNKGTLYTGKTILTKEGKNCTYEDKRVYHLLVYEEAKNDGTTQIMIKGWAERYVKQVCTMPDGQQKIFEIKLHADIKGIEIAHKG